MHLYWHIHMCTITNKWVFMGIHYHSHICINIQASTHTHTCTNKNRISHNCTHTHTSCEHMRLSARVIYKCTSTNFKCIPMHKGWYGCCWMWASKMQWVWGCENICSRGDSKGKIFTLTELNRKRRILFVERGR